MTAEIFSILLFLRPMKNARKGTKNILRLHIGCRQLIGKLLYGLCLPILGNSLASYSASASANYGKALFLRELWTQEQTSKAEFGECAQSRLTYTTGVS